jgi:hypothetical protein
MTIVAFGFGISPGSGSGGLILDPTRVTYGTLENRMLTRIIQNTLYQLKRRFGGTIAVYQIGDATVDLETGVKTIPQDVLYIRRAVILPAKVAREVTQTLSVISANKKFVYGGTYDTATRLFIIDHKDAPNLKLKESDYIVYKERRYEVKDFQEFEFDAAWVVTGRAVEGDVFEQIYPLAADNLMRLDQSSGQTKN